MNDSSAEVPGAYKKLVTLQPVPGLTQKFLLAVPANSAGILILLPGGPGKINLSESFGKPTINNYQNNFLVDCPLAAAHAMLLARMAFTESKISW